MMNQHQQIRRARKAVYENKIELNTQLEHFIKDCFGKSEKEIIEDLYPKYESIWIKHCRYKNGYAARHEEAGKKKYKPLVLLEDAFERSCMNGHKKIKQAKAANPTQELIEFERIFEIMRHHLAPSRFERFMKFMRSKGFFVKGNNAKFIDPPKPNLKVVQE